MYKHSFHSRRLIAAWLFLAIMFTQGICEIGILSIININEFLDSSKPKVCGIKKTTVNLSSDTNTTIETGDSCCSQPKEQEKTACGCTCCGDVCRMGAACTCQHGRHAPPLGTFFFEVPSCGTGDGKMITSVPPSLQLVYIVPALTTLDAYTMLEYLNPIEEESYPEGVQLPPVPPPRCTRFVA